MRLTTKSRYGLRLILDLAVNADNGPVSLSAMAVRQKISLKYLEKLVRTLKAAGIILSHRGAHGGYELALELNAISVGDIVRVLEEQSAITECAETTDYTCTFCKETGECLARLVWREASRSMFAYLDAITLDILMSQRSGIRVGEKKSDFYRDIRGFRENK
jgi:Rrf2 family transcriptional regulator, iron-sulfur cluster assembly transcription factor